MLLLFVVSDERSPFNSVGLDAARFNLDADLLVSRRGSLVWNNKKLWTPCLVDCRIVLYLKAIDIVEVKM